MEHLQDYSNFAVRNCGVPCCKVQHFIKFIQGKAVIPSWKLIQIERCCKKNIERLCGIVCKNDNLCKLHKKLNTFLFFSNYITDRNIERNDVVCAANSRFYGDIIVCLTSIIGFCLVLFESKRPF